MKVSPYVIIVAIGLIIIGQQTFPILIENSIDKPLKIVADYNPDSGKIILPGASAEILMGNMKIVIADSPYDYVDIHKNQAGVWTDYKFGKLYSMCDLIMRLNCNIIYRR